MSKPKIKLLYTEDGKVLFSKFWPEDPPVKASIYADELAMRNYRSRLNEAIRSAVPVSNPDVAITHIVFNERLERGKVYEIEADYIFENGNMRVLKPSESLAAL